MVSEQHTYEKHISKNRLISIKIKVYDLSNLGEHKVRKRHNFKARTNTWYVFYSFIVRNKFFTSGILIIGKNSNKTTSRIFRTPESLYSVVAPY